MYNNADRPILNDGKTGFFVERDKQKVLELIQFLVENPAKVEKLGVQASERVQKKYSNKNMLPQIEDIYNNVLNNHK